MKKLVTSLTTIFYQIWPEWCSTRTAETRARADRADCCNMLEFKTGTELPFTEASSSEASAVAQADPTVHPCDEPKPKTMDKHTVSSLASSKPRMSPLRKRRCSRGVPGTHHFRSTGAGAAGSQVALGSRRTTPYTPFVHSRIWLTHTQKAGQKYRAARRGRQPAKRPDATNKHTKRSDLKAACVLRRKSMLWASWHVLLSFMRRFGV